MSETSKYRFETPEFFRNHGRKILEQHPEWVAWFEQEIGEWFAPEYIAPGPRHFCDINPCPPFYSGWCEFEFRRGFYYGSDEAIRQIYLLKNKGFIRPAEIGNILCRWWESVVCPWKSRWRSECENGIRYETPSLNHESWWDIRKRIIKRDGGRCVTLGCGSTDDLHVDHIEPVCEGGLPTDDNLQCLCKRCNYAKGSTL